MRNTTAPQNCADCELPLTQCRCKDYGREEEYRGDHLSYQQRDDYNATAHLFRGRE